jgi:hypothetical protein
MAHEDSLGNQYSNLPIHNLRYSSMTPLYVGVRLGGNCIQTSSVLSLLGLSKRALSAFDIRFHSLIVQGRVRRVASKVPWRAATFAAPSTKRWISASVSRCKAEQSRSPSNGFSYYMCASYAPKQRKFHPESDTYAYDPRASRASDPPKKKSRSSAGQDAFFIARINKTGGVAAGVVWHSLNVD